MPTSPMPDWISIYADFNRAAPIPVQTLANYADVTVVAGTLIVLNEILDKCKTMPVQPKTISVYADVLQIHSSLTPDLRNGGLVLCARRIEVTDGASILFDFTAKPVGKLVLFCHEVGGTLLAETTSAPTNGTTASQVETFDLTDRTVFGSVLSGHDGTAAIQHIADFQDSGLSYGSPLRINVVTILQYGMAAFYSHPEVARSMFSYVLRVTSGSSEARELYMQASAILGNLVANASPVTFVPYLDQEVYKTSMASFITAASTYETQYQRFADQGASAADRITAAKLLLDNNRDVMGMNAQLIAQAQKISPMPKLRN